MMWWMDIAFADYLPRQASTIAGDVDAVYNFILYVSIFFFILLMGGMVFFVVKYRRRSDTDKTAYITHNHTLEFLWSFIPLVLLLGTFFWGWKVYKEARTFPENAVEIDIHAKQWAWDMLYYDNGGPNGTKREIKRETNLLVVPAKKPVILNMTSVGIPEQNRDPVLHSFYVPSFRVKQDVVPGKISRLWFQADEPGDYQVFCAEYCGTAHSQMMAKVRVIPLSEYQKWLTTDESAGMSLAGLGEKLFNSKTCVACHSVDGSAKVGPTWKGVYGRKGQFEDGGSYTADDAYIRESILDPQKHVVKGFANAGLMPSFQGQVTDEEISAIIEYMKTLK